MTFVIFAEDKNGVCLSQEEQDRRSLQHDQSSVHQQLTDEIENAQPA